MANLFEATIAPPELKSSLRRADDSWEVEDIPLLPDIHVSPDKKEEAQAKIGQVISAFDALDHPILIPAALYNDQNAVMSAKLRTAFEFIVPSVAYTYTTLVGERSHGLTAHQAWFDENENRATIYHNYLRPFLYMKVRGNGHFFISRTSLGLHTHEKIGMAQSAMANQRTGVCNIEEYKNYQMQDETGAKIPSQTKKLELKEPSFESVMAMGAYALNYLGIRDSHSKVSKLEEIIAADETANSLINSYIKAVEPFAIPMARSPLYSATRW